jgi:hypothetical protein
MPKTPNFDDYLTTQPEDRRRDLGEDDLVRALEGMDLVHEVLTLFNALNHGDGPLALAALQDAAYEAADEFRTQADED